MTKARKLPTLLASAAGPAFALLVIAFFGGYAVLGSNGVLAWSDYKRQIGVRSAELERLKAQKAVLANRVDLLDPRHANPDMVDELVRKELGVAHPDEVIIPLK
ncbi:FtsB family cell division protein [Sphingomonas sanxanigenens]|uniref:FtsB family cell division protein n=1 Tax=Sphingomonas sanxanigenens TaxID=397260 RepID=UPI00046C8C71|nr:septum formation initiator family protein [Sphingomonas sanxanigenens]